MTTNAKAIFAALLLAFLMTSSQASEQALDILHQQALQAPQQTEQKLNGLLAKPENLTLDDKINAYLLLAQVTYLQGKTNESIRNAQYVVELSTKSNHPNQLAEANYVIANNFFDSRDHHMALAYLETSLLYFKQINDQKMLANIYVAMARGYSALNQNEKAMSAYLSSFKIILQHQRWNQLVGIYYGIAEPYLWIDDSIAQFNHAQERLALLVPPEQINSAIGLLNNVAVWQFFGSLALLLLGITIWHIYSKKREIAHLETRVAQQKEHINTISVIGRQVTSSLELNTVAEYVYSHIKELFDADVFSIGIYDKNRELIDFPFTIEKGKALEDYQIHMKDTERLAVWCISNRKEVVLSQISDSDKYVKTKQTAAAGGMMQSIVYIPLMVEQNIVGCITVQREQVGSFNEFQLNMMQSIASYTAIAVDNALTHRELKLASNTDYLTKLRNRRAFVEKAEYQLAVVERNNSQLCVAITDIDNFKIFNDTYGHDCGDFVLKTVAKTFISNIRKQDIVARWGGEEFVFMLPNTDLENAQFLLDKVRATIAAQEFEYKDQKFKISLTFGVTQAQNGIGLTQLMNTADEALYQGKQQGKNIIIAKQLDATNNIIQASKVSAN